MTNERFDFMIEVMKTLTALLDHCELRGLAPAGHQAILDRIRALSPDEFAPAPPNSAKILHFPSARR